MRHDRAGSLPFFVSDLEEAWDIGIRLLLLAGADEVTIRAEVSRQLFAIFGIRCARPRLGKCLGHPEQQCQAENDKDARAHSEASACRPSYIQMQGYIDVGTLHPTEDEMAGKDAEMPSQQALSEDIQEIAKHLAALRKDLEALTGQIRRTGDHRTRRGLPRRHRAQALNFRS